MKKKFEVCYWFHLSNTIEVEAENRDEAERTVQKMLENGEIGNINEMDVDSSGVEAI